jgi:hypothetical protein
MEGQKIKRQIDDLLSFLSFVLCLLSFRLFSFHPFFNFTTFSKTT